MPQRILRFLEFLRHLVEIQMIGYLERNQTANPKKHHRHFLFAVVVYAPELNKTFQNIFSSKAGKLRGYTEMIIHSFRVKGLFLI